METLSQISQRENAIGIVNLPIADVVPAAEFYEILQGLDYLYFGSLWLSHAEKAVPGRPFPDFYSPLSNEKLYIQKLEIGSPNFISLVGILSCIPPILSVVADAVQVATGVISIIKSPVKIELLGKKNRKNLSKSEQTDAQSSAPDDILKVYEDMLRVKKALEFSRSNPDTKVEMRTYIGDVPYRYSSKAAELHQQGKISSQALAHKQEMDRFVERELKPLLREFVGKPGLTIIHYE
jgi:hypothetical protein